MGSILLKLLKKGAEADIFLTSWSEKKAILKIRKKKEYRNEILDARLRTLRTIREGKMIHEAKTFGVTTPIVYFVDPQKCEIYLQFIDGKLVRDLPQKSIIKKCKDIGKIVGTLHKNGLMHGDLTTSNFILSRKGLVLLDFGLAQRANQMEDYAIDLRLFKEVLNSAHAHIFQEAWDSFLQGYEKTLGKIMTAKVTSHVQIIEKRGRYANVI